MMKSIFRIAFVFCTVVMCNKSSFSQVTDKSIKKSNKMDNAEKKEMIHILYDSIFNKKQYEKLSGIISPDYSNQYGEKGVAAFQKTIVELSAAFPDAHWEVTEIIADGNKVVVKQKFTGTHKNKFQNIQPTNRTVSTNGIVIYEYAKDKIIGSEVQTDRLGFLQQLNVLPVDISTLSQKNENEKTVYFVDKFLIPQNSIEEFTLRMKYNRSFIKNLSGFIKDEVYEQKDEEGNLIIITIAAWQSQDNLNNAKSAVQAEYKRIDFNPIEFYQRLNIKMDRGQYSILND